jgi:hypothetical protein
MDQVAVGSGRLAADPPGEGVLHDQPAGMAVDADRVGRLAGDVDAEPLQERGAGGLADADHCLAAVSVEKGAAEDPDVASLGDAEPALADAVRRQPDEDVAPARADDAGEARIARARAREGQGVR